MKEENCFILFNMKTGTLLFAAILLFMTLNLFIKPCARVCSNTSNNKMWNPSAPVL